MGYFIEIDWRKETPREKVNTLQESWPCPQDGNLEGGKSRRESTSISGVGAEKKYHRRETDIDHAGLFLDPSLFSFWHAQ